MQALLDTVATLPRPTEAQRFFHGRGGRHPGCEAWTLDAYPPVWLVTCFGAASDGDLAQIDAALHARWAEVAPGEPLTWLFQQRDDARSIDAAHNRVMAGQVPDDHTVSEDGARYQVHLTRGQNHGFFLDMAEGRRWVRRWAAAHPGAAVLNLFAYTGAFSVAALQGGAGRVVNVDMARGALNTARTNHRLNGLPTASQPAHPGASFLDHDVFTSWAKIRRAGPYGLVILDPPSFQKGSFVATKDYARLVRRLPELLGPGGQALLCLNTPKLGPEFLLDLLASEAPAMRVDGRLPNPPAFADVSEARALKVVVATHPPNA